MIQFIFGTNMPKNTRRTRVTLAIRRRWLALADEGWTVERIAQHETGDDQPDPRTIRKHIALARSERERGEIHRAIYRQAVEAHQTDLLGVASRLRQALKSPEGSPWMIRRIDDALDDEARLRKALREHLGSSPVWQGIERWNKACSEFDKDRLALQSRATLAAEQAGLLGGDHPDGMVQILRQDTGHRLCGFPVVELTYDPVNGKAGAMGLPKASGDAGSEMRRRFDQLRGELPEWPEFKRLQSTFDRARQVRAGLDDELAAVVLRRVIAGDCWLCPFGASKRRKEVGQS